MFQKGKRAHQYHVPILVTGIKWSTTRRALWQLFQDGNYHSASCREILYSNKQLLHFRGNIYLGYDLVWKPRKQKVWQLSTWSMY